MCGTSPLARPYRSDGLEVQIPASKPGANIRQVGSDTAQGERLLTKGCRLGAAELGILAALGMRRAWGGTQRAEPSERDGPEAAATGDLVMSGSVLFFSFFLGVCVCVELFGFGIDFPCSCLFLCASLLGVVWLPVWFSLFGSRPPGFKF
ncbi:unnamed protein product [Effrenium voratum]|nr:unnamed protein product [Effrenium voratum]